MPPSSKIHTGDEVFDDFTLEEPVILGYWGIRGRGQPLRHLAAFLNLPLEDKVYKSPSEWFDGDKKNLPLDFPNLPYVADKSAHLTEMVAIAEYMIRRANKYSKE